MELKIKVEKTKLITALKQNKVKHVADYKEAMSNWKNELSKIIDSAKTSLLNQEYSPFTNRTHQVFRIDACPSSHEKDYDKAIEMLEFSSDQEIQIDLNQYNAFVKDEWHWRNAWNINNSKYLNAAS